MKILIIGNSHCACIKNAYDFLSRKNINCLGGFAPSWIVVPGGWGPNIRVEDSKLSVTSIDADFPPKYWPNEDIMQAPIHDYDCIIISALCPVDGGWAYKNHLSSNDDMWPSFLEETQVTARTPVSRALYSEIVKAFFDITPGVQLVKSLRSYGYDRSVLIQPSPMPSKSLISHKGWHVRALYKEPIAANEFFHSIKNEYLAELSSDLNLTLLSYPLEICRGSDFTPDKYMENDMVHGNHMYGELVLAQIHDHIKALRSTSQGI